MPPTRSEKAVVIKTSERVSKLAPALRFPLFILLSFTFSSLLYSLSSQILGTEGDLAAVSRKLDQWWEVSALLGWRTCELALGWWGGYDGIDLAALNALSHGPPAYLLGTFYGVRATTIISSLLIDTLTTALPMHLLRPLSPEHSSESQLPTEQKDVISSLSIQALTTILATVIYSTTLFGAYTSFLPTSLVTYFEGIPTIAPAHAARPETLFPVMLIMGLASKSFIFTPAAAMRLNLGDINHKAFNPQTATLWGTLVHNLWGYSAKTKVVIKRTLTLMLASGMNTFIQTLVTIAGVEAKGAAAYSSVWVVASLLTGAAYGIITDV